MNVSILYLNLYGSLEMIKENEKLLYKSQDASNLYPKIRYVDNYVNNRHCYFCDIKRWLLNYSNGYRD